MSRLIPSTLPPESGQRRSLVEQYYHAVAFSSWRDVQKVLRVYENVLLELEERIKHPTYGQKDEYAEKQLSLLLRCLQRDGFVFANSRITPDDAATRPLRNCPSLPQLWTIAFFASKLIESEMRLRTILTSPSVRPRNFLRRPAEAFSQIMG